jgi:hypothetical protein
MRIWQYVKSVITELERQLSGEYERRAELVVVPVVRRRGRAT